MDNLVTISNVKANVLEFNVEVKGIDSGEMAVRFVIEAAEMNLAFDSEPSDDNLWTVKIPALTMLDTTSYPFRIDVIVDGYHFDAMKGAINVVGAHDIYASKPENITLSPSKKKPKAKMIKQKVEAKKAEAPAKLTTKKIEKVKVEEPEKIVKPNRKFEMTPLDVQDGKELFKALNSKGANHVRKTDTKLDNKIDDLLAKAKKEKKKADEKSKKPEPIINEPKIEVKKDEPVKKVAAKIATRKKAKPKKKSNTKSIAEKIIQAVTGIGSKEKEPVAENPKDVAMKEILAEDAKISKKSKPKKVTKKVGGIKKIGKDNTIKEIDEVKEQKMKEVLTEMDEAETKKTVTTRPFKKKDVTIH